MRRGLTAAVVLVAGLLTLGGCGGRPPGVDGNLTDDWSAMPAAEVPTPPEHVCYLPGGDLDPGSLGRVRPTMDCVGATVETVHVGVFSGGDATTDHVPADDSAGMRAAYADCNRQAADFLGGDWRTGHLELFVTPPLPEYWTAGARWYRCDLANYPIAGWGRASPLGGSLRGALAGDRRSARGCVTIVVKDDNIDRIEPADCGQPHNGEFGGIFEEPDGPPPGAGKDDKGVVDAGCARVNGSFVGVDASSMENRVGWAAWGFGPQAWKQGNHGVQCYLWFDDKPVTGSKRGVGAKGLPVRYA